MSLKHENDECPSPNAACKTLLLVDIPPDEDEETILLHLEDKKKGFGDVQKNDAINREKRSMLVTFEDEKGTFYVFLLHNFIKKFND